MVKVTDQELDARIAELADKIEAQLATLEERQLARLEKQLEKERNGK